MSTLLVKYNLPFKGNDSNANGQIGNELNSTELSEDGGSNGSVNSPSNSTVNNYKNVTNIIDAIIVNLTKPIDEKHTGMTDGSSVAEGPETVLNAKTTDKSNSEMSPTKFKSALQL